MRLEILQTVILFFGGGICSGYAVRHILKFKKEGVCFSLITGIICWWAVMELILVPMTMMHRKFHEFVMVYSIVIFLLSAAGLLFWKEMLGELKCMIKGCGQYLSLGYLTAFLLIAFQLYFIHHHMYLEWDDTYYVNLANEAINSDQIYWVYPETGIMADFDKRYVLSLWPIFYAWLSKLIGVVPTIMAHTILPWLMIPLAYAVYELIGRRLFQQDREICGMFLALAVLLHLFMSGVHTTGITFLLITPWVGKGILAGILIPLLFYWILRTCEENKAGNWIMLGTAGIGGCLSSSMGIMLLPVFIGVTIVLVSLKKRDIHYLLCGGAACIPCVLFGVYYLYLTH